MSINYIKYNNIKNVGEDTPELILMNSKVGVDVIDKEKFSKKLKERNSKQESTSLFDQLMEMVLTEGTDYDTALSHVFDIVVNKEIISTEESIRRYKDIAINKLYSINIKMLIFKFYHFKSNLFIN